MYPAPHLPTEKIRRKSRAFATELTALAKANRV